MAWRVRDGAACRVTDSQKQGCTEWNIFSIAPFFPRQATHGPLSATDEHVKSYDDAVEHHLSPFTPSLTLSLAVQCVVFQCFTRNVREVKDIDVKNLQLVIHTSVPKKEVHNESAKAQGLGGSGLSVNYTVVRVTVIVNGWDWWRRAGQLCMLSILVSGRRKALSLQCNKI